MIRLKNIFNKIPCQIIDEKIYYNNKNFYIIDSAENINQLKLLYSESYSEILLMKLRNNNDLKKDIPNHIENIFNDLYIIFNKNNIDTDIISRISNRFLNNYNNYENIYTNGKIDINALVNFPDSLKKTTDDITNMNTLINQRYDITNKYISNNQFHRRFYNTIAHTITLHFSSVFYNLIYDLLMDTNKEIIDLYINDFIELKSNIFKFDPNYKEPNLAQMIILNLYKIKYNDEIIENRSFSSLVEILKYKMSEFNNIIVSSRVDNISENLEKIYDYMNTYFDTFNKVIVLFLTNYVKFIELQYNLQEISKLLIANS